MRSRTFRHIIRVLVTAAVLLVGSPAQEGEGYAAEPVRKAQGEYQVKAAFVYNFIKFVDWPAGSERSSNELLFCVMGTVPDMGPFEDLQGQEIMGKRLTVTQVRERGPVEDCQVLFISSALSPRMKDVLDLIARKPILTVGDTDGYARQGIMINMYLERKRVRFEINARSARESGLQISAKLLSLAGTVYDDGAGRE
jgi:hypothetical protein